MSSEEQKVDMGLVKVEPVEVGEECMVQWDGTERFCLFPKEVDPDKSTVLLYGLQTTYALTPNREADLDSMMGDTDGDEEVEIIEFSESSPEQAPFHVPPPHPLSDAQIPKEGPPQPPVLISVPGRPPPNHHAPILIDIGELLRQVLADGNTASVSSTIAMGEAGLLNIITPKPPHGMQPTGTEVVSSTLPRGENDVKTLTSKPSHDKQQNVTGEVSCIPSRNEPSLIKVLTPKDPSKVSSKEPFKSSFIIPRENLHLIKTQPRKRPCDRPRQVPSSSLLKEEPKLLKALTPKMPSNRPLKVTGDAISTSSSSGKETTTQKTYKMILTAEQARACRLKKKVCRKLKNNFYVKVEDVLGSAFVALARLFPNDAVFARTRATHTGLVVERRERKFIPALKRNRRRRDGGGTKLGREMVAALRAGVRLFTPKVPTSSHSELVQNPSLSLRPRAIPKRPLLGPGSSPRRAIYPTRHSALLANFDVAKSINDSLDIRSKISQFTAKSVVGPPRSQVGSKQKRPEVAVVAPRTLVKPNWSSQTNSSENNKDVQNPKGPQGQMMSAKASGSQNTEDPKNPKSLQGPTVSSAHGSMSQCEFKRRFTDERGNSLRIPKYPSLPQTLQELSEIKRKTPMKAIVPKPSMKRVCPPPPIYLKKDPPTSVPENQAIEDFDNDASGLSEFIEEVLKEDDVQPMDIDKVFDNLMDCASELGEGPVSPTEPEDMEKGEVEPEEDETEEDSAEDEQDVQPVIPDDDDLDILITTVAPGDTIPLPPPRPFHTH